MAYDEQLAFRIRGALASLQNVEEKQMMGGITWMLNGKMCVGIVGDELMCRIDPDFHAEAITKPGCRTMDFTNKPMKGFVFVSPDAISTAKALQYWIDRALEFNPKAKASKKKAKR